MNKNLDKIVREDELEHHHIPMIWSLLLLRVSLLVIATDRLANVFGDQFIHSVPGIILQAVEENGTESEIQGDETAPSRTSPHRSQVEENGKEGRFSASTGTVRIRVPYTPPPNITEKTGRYWAGPDAVGEDAAVAAAEEKRAEDDGGGDVEEEYKPETYGTAPWKHLSGWFPPPVVAGGGVEHAVPLRTGFVNVCKRRRW
ncbi:hypothetical protein C8R44DRAFT_750321 [Mycena epipterygia]|nr:hypothetical protein C8R44DRAFT_750321 [Mycena epipterygia]